MKNFIKKAAPIVCSLVSAFGSLTLGAIIAVIIECNIFNTFIVFGMLVSIAVATLYGMTAVRLFVEAAVEAAEEK